uniref:Ubiquitinyl hydrolase 1 n=1 Tax=Syphacia muris TaxID=451379 RepID=A0A0N5AKJ3_9BILA
MACDCDGEKWSCSQCTYLNYQKAKVCTMCRNPRHSPFITEPPNTSSASYIDGDASAQTTSSQKRWPCPDCTYMNVLKSRHCAVCSCKRPGDYSSEASRQASGENDSVNDLRENAKLSKALRKWDCSKCTYNNWPTVKQCTMCGNPREYIHNSTADDNNPSNPQERGKQSQKGYEDASGVQIKTKLHRQSSLKCAAVKAEGSSSYYDDKLSALERHFYHLKKTVDTGCAAFLEAVLELICPGSDSDEKLLYYIYNYGEPNRKITVFESILLNGFEEDEHMLYDLTLVDLLRTRFRSKLANVPRFFVDSALYSVSLPGLEEESSEEVDVVYEVYDSGRVANNGSIFTLPNAICDLRPWITSGDHSLRVLMDFDDRQVLNTVCCLDTPSLASISSSHIYAPLILRNRGRGHSLVDAVSQSLWGVVDKANILRDAIFQMLCTKESLFRNRWASALMKSGIKFDLYTMHRYWTTIMECQVSDAPLEKIHILVLAQVLNRPIIVLPVEASRLSSMRDGSRKNVKHYMEGFYPQLPGLSNYRLCAPILLGYSNGNFHALVLPPPMRSPALGRIEIARCSKVFRYVRCPPFSLNQFVQFAFNDAEAEEFIRDGLVIDVDPSGQQWIYHSTFGFPLPEPDRGTRLWSEWLLTHFPTGLDDDEDDDCNDDQEVGPGSCDVGSTRSDYDTDI